MHVKSLRRAVILAVAMVASSLSLVTLSTAPAHATAYNSFSELHSNYSAIRYGSAITLTARVGYDEVNPTYVNAGTATLQRQVYGATTWSNFSVRTIDSTTGDITWTIKPSKTTKYRIAYSGGAYNADTYSASTSNIVRVAVRRNLNDNFRRSDRLFYGKVAPKFANRAVYIQKSTCTNPTGSSCSWSAYKTIRTNGTSNWSLKLPVYARKTHFRAYIPASSGYAGSLSNYYVSTWRS